MSEGVIAITPEGQVRLIYQDALRGLLSEGDSVIRRSSHVEPQGTEWTADLSPVGGPVLGPFPTREEALSEEAAWLTRNRL